MDKKKISINKGTPRSVKKTYVIWSFTFLIINFFAIFIKNSQIKTMDILSTLVKASIVIWIINILYEKSFYVKDRFVDRRKIFTIFCLILFVCYSICFLTYFPGVGMNDGLNIFRSGMKLSGQFPVFYCGFLTLLAKIGTHLGSLQYSVIFYSFIQLCLCVFMTSGILLWIWLQPISRKYKYFTVIFFAFFPLFGLYAISMVKDTLFSIGLVLFSILLYEILRKNRNFKSDKIVIFLFCLSAITVVLMRTNGIYIVLFSLMIAFLVSKKKNVILGCIAVVLLAMGFNALALRRFNDRSYAQEALAIPIQQVAATVAECGKLGNEKKLIAQIMPLEEIKKSYNPYTADPIKWNSNFDREFLDNHKREFLLCWLKLFPINFKVYVSAYCRQTYYFWAPIQDHKIQCFYTIETIYDNYWLKDFLKQSGIHDHSLMPKFIRAPLQSYYRLASIFFNEGVCFWMGLTIFIADYQKNKEKGCIFLYLPAFGLWLTLMLSTPVASSFRYVLVYAYILPVFFSRLFTGDIKQENK